MKLSAKLTLFITLSKLSIVVFFVLMLPFMVDKISFQYTNYVLGQQKKKVLEVVARDGVDFYLQGNNSYGSYTLLKEEYISLEPVVQNLNLDTLETAERVVENDTLNYRILSHTFKAGNQKYLLEIGRITSSNSQYNRPLQWIALYVLLGLIFLTLLIDLIFTHSLVKPLDAIIRSKLTNRKFPFSKHLAPVRTTTSDFQYLDQTLILLMEQINEAFEKEREFTANASHELMTPISILQNKIENLLGSTEASGAVQQSLAEMLGTLSRLKKIVHSLLLISRIENEQFTKSDTAEVKSLLKEVINEIGHRMEEQQIHLEMKISGNRVIPGVNRDLLFQLFYNLVNNAIRYNNPHGTITITDEYKKGTYTVFIRDTGIGIPEEELPLVFNRFKKSRLSGTSGYGLGLSIVKSIADYHSLQIGLHSEVNQGTMVSVIFPQGKG